MLLLSSTCFNALPLRLLCSTKGGFQIRVLGTSLGYRGGSRRILVATHQYPNLTLSENATAALPSDAPNDYPFGWQVQ